MDSYAVQPTCHAGIAPSSGGADMSAKSAAVPLLRVDNVSFTVRDQSILQAVSLEIHAGEIIALIGPNGAGKSTLVRIALGLIKPNCGQVWRKPGLRIGYMPQRLAIDHNLPLTVQRFITLGGPTSRTQVAAVLAEVGVPQLMESPVQAISGGELQRVLLARALLREPDLLVLDEPIQGVDLSGQYELYDLISQLRQQRGCGILMISHELHLVMATTDQVLCLNRQVCCSGHPDQVANDPAYLQLFGFDVARRLAVYHHHHHPHAATPSDSEQVCDG